MTYVNKKKQKKIYSSQSTKRTLLPIISLILKEQIFMLTKTESKEITR